MRLLRLFQLPRRSVPLFETGRIVVTGAARALLRRARIPAAQFFARHAAGDWGDIDPIDRQQNELGLRLSLRIRSVYLIPAGGADATENLQSAGKSSTGHVAIWIVTKPNRTQTTIFLPSEIFDDANIEIED